MPTKNLNTVAAPEQTLAESLLQNIPNWQKVVQALPDRGCLLVTRLKNHQTNPNIDGLAKNLTEQGTTVYIVSVDE